MNPPVPSADIVIRPLANLDEFHAFVDAEREIWGMADPVEAVPVHLLITAQKNGGLVLGAFDDHGQMVGLLFGFLGMAPDGRIKHCSHMMGVRPAYRGHDLGYALKRAQRGFVLRQGLDLITWTFDPLEAVNAYLNIARLGAICHTYLRNIYGDMRDALNLGLPSDRFEVAWWIASERVYRGLAMGGSRLSSAAVLAEGGALANRTQPGVDGQPTPAGWTPGLEAGRVLVEIPSSFQRVKAANPQVAHAWRMETRAIFEHYFAAGYTVVDFIREGDGDARRTFYVLQRAPVDLTPRGAIRPVERSTEEALEEAMALFNAGRYWETHEVLEESWHKAEGDTRLFLQGLIQAAAAFHKWRVQHNHRGLVRHLRQSLEKLAPFEPIFLGLNVAEFGAGLRAVLAAAERTGPDRLSDLDPALIPALRWM